MRLKFSLAILVLTVVSAIWWAVSHTGYVIFSPKGESSLDSAQDKPYEKYSFENLVNVGWIASSIEIVGDKFYYYSHGKRISGQINLPARTVLAGAKDVYPVVVMARGYVEKAGYKTGTGTKNAAKYYAEHGYITLAPDFSGYGESDPEDPNALGARLSKPVEILDLIESIPTLEIAKQDEIYLWGHSNGGQIMISVAEILGEFSRRYNGSVTPIKGLTLWAPVSKPFPYNILYYTDDASDSGKWLRNQVAQFERDYDVFNYSIDRYLGWINIPVQIHQGSADEAVPKKWSDTLVQSLKSKDKRITYFVYPGADHNLKPGWDEVVARDVEWFGSLR